MSTTTSSTHSESVRLAGEVLDGDAIDASFQALAEEFRTTLHNVLGSLVPHGRRGLTEFALVMVGLPRHAALAASDAETREEAEAWIKLSVHWTRASDHWRRVLERVTGISSDQVHPLPTTQALQLALEELATTDRVAYYACVHAFGSPVDPAGVAALRSAFGALAEDDAGVLGLLDEWVAYATSEDNYASVRSLREMGWLRADEIRQAVLASKGAVSTVAWQRSAARVRSVADTVSLAAFGVRHFFGESGETWPRRRPSWAGVVK